MPATEYSCQMAGGVPVVTAPAEIDTTTAGQLRAILIQSQSRGHATVVVDLTGTVFCDSAGLRELVVAHKRAASAGGGLRLITPADSVFLRIFSVLGLEGIIPHFPTMTQALAEMPAAASRRLRQGPVLDPEGALASSPAHPQKQDGPAADRRRCAHCGAVFVPVREHARFCTPGGPRHRAHLRPSRHLPHPHRRERSAQHRYQPARRPWGR